MDVRNIRSLNVVSLLFTIFFSNFLKNWMLMRNDISYVILEHFHKSTEQIDDTSPLSMKNDSIQTLFTNQFTQ